MFRLLTGTMAVLFLLGAAVQYNDPDPLRWMAIYLAAAAACLLHVLGKSRWWLPAIVAAVALGWAVTLAPAVIPNVRIAEMFAAWEMANERVEDGREMYGLLIIFVYMCVLGLMQRRRNGPARLAA